MKKSALFLASATSALFLTSAAMADDAASNNQNISIEQAAQHLHYSGGNDRFRIELAPNYSEELGFSMKGAAGAYLTDEIALGLIVEYGENKREYLGNAGIQFNDALSLVGTVGMLEENYEFIAGDGRKSVQQMEYGASLKGAYEVGILSGFELNGYLTNADAGSKTVETGDLYGVQLLADFDLTDTTHFKLGGGYEWLEWADGDNNDSFAFSAEGVQQLGDMFSINANASIGASQNVYGGGLALDLSRDGLNTNMIGLSYDYIDGKNGIEDDQRVELSWTYGFGAGPTQMASAETQDAGAIRPAADVAMVAPANNLLNDVTKRPAYLPQTVVARAKKSDEPNPPPNPTCPYTVYASVNNTPSSPADVYYPGGSSYSFVWLYDNASGGTGIGTFPAADEITLDGVVPGYLGLGVVPFGKGFANVYFAGIPSQNPAPFVIYDSAGTVLCNIMLTPAPV